MKTLATTLLIAVLLMANSAFAENYPPPHRQIVDKYGNGLITYEWTKFEWEKRFIHPNGNSYPLNSRQTTWVYTTPYNQNKFQGWMAVAGITAGTIDGYYQGYFKNGWNSWNEVERFTWIAGTPILWGMALDSQYPDACRWMGGFQGSLAAISILSHSDDNDLKTISLAVGAAVSSYALGWLFDKYRKVPEQNTFRYKLRHR